MAHFKKNIGKYMKDNRNKKGKEIQKSLKKQTSY